MNWIELANLGASLLLAGWVASFLTQLIKREAWPSTVKLILSIVLAALVGLATAWVDGSLLDFIGNWGSLSAEQVLTFGTLIYASSSTWYRFYFKDAVWAQALGSWPGGGK